MPTIAFISPKGGVGKTTAALLLASQLARGAKVSVVDADPSHPIAAWGKDAQLPDNLSVRRQNIWHNSRRELTECGPRLGVNIRRRACGAASADVRWSVA